jgi:FixJ family two-component response regulator
MYSGASEPEQILIVEDDSGLRDIFVNYLVHSGHRVTAVGSGQEALWEIQRDKFRVAALDVQLPDIHGVELARWLRRYQPGLRVLFVTAFGSIDVAVEAMRQGALHYLEKPVDLPQLREIIEKILRKERRDRHLRRRMQELTDRERDVLARLAQGKTNDELAQDLSLSIHTVNTHVRNILQKLRVNNRVQAALLWDHLGEPVNVAQFGKNT